MECISDAHNGSICETHEGNAINTVRLWKASFINVRCHRTPPSRAGPLRPGARARRLRRRLRRPHQGAASRTTIVAKALQVLINLEHRGACGCEANTGDGAGILIQMPDAFLRKAAASARAAAPERGYGAGLVFLPRDARDPRRDRDAVRAHRRARKGSGCSAGATCRPTTPARAERRGGRAGLPADLHRPRRRVAAPGASARATRAFERKLYVIRKRIEHAVDALEARRAVASASSTSSACRRNTLIYKGMLTAEQIGPMFPDLTDPDAGVGAGAGAPALQHQHVSRRGRWRIRTATSPTTARSTRCAATSTGCARAKALLAVATCSATTSKKILPIIREGGSDTAMFDNVLELLVMAGRSLPHAMLMMIPEPWQQPRAHEPGAARRSTSTTRR